MLCDKQYKWCQFPSLSFNFFLSLTGSVIYLIGSAMFIPVINQSNLGLILFIVGSSFIMVSQTWKLLRVIYDGYKHKNVCGEVKADANGFLVDLFAGLGGACYFTGSFLMFNPDTNVYNLGVYIFILGGFCFFLSGIFMLFRYFCCRKTVHDNEHTEMKSPMVSKWPHNYWYISCYRYLLYCKSFFTLLDSNIFILFCFYFFSVIEYKVNILKYTIIYQYIFPSQPHVLIDICFLISNHAPMLFMTWCIYHHF